MRGVIKLTFPAFPLCKFSKNKIRKRPYPLKNPHLNPWKNVWRMMVINILLSLNVRNFILMKLLFNIKSSFFCHKTISPINDTNTKKLIYSIQYNNFLKQKLGSSWPFCFHNQLSSIHVTYYRVHPVNIYLAKVINRNNRKKCERCQ